MHVAPDASRVAYQLLGAPNEGTELHSVRPDGTGAVRLNSPVVQGDLALNVDWSPDSSRIAYVVREQGLVREQEQDTLFSVLPDGSGSTKVMDTFDYADWPWAPDGSRIAFVTRDVTNTAAQLFIAKPDGTDRMGARQGARFPRGFCVVVPKL